MSNELPRSPYRLLVPFGTEDSDIFFGRDRETTHLVAEVLTNRIVVLFARTGTGKTSLLNAGVIPALKEKGFHTLYVRTGDDPLGELSRKLAEDLHLQNHIAADPVTALIDHVKTSSESSFVLIVDQFEEFFNNVHAKSLIDAENFRERVAAAIDDIGIPLHFIFSLREEYFARMIFFREAIPRIFDAGFSVELSGLGPLEAEEAIRRPAERLGVHFAKPLVQRLISELGGPTGVETAVLQIVCDTLFRQRAEPHSVTEADLDRSVLAGTVRLGPQVRAKLNKAHEIIILRIVEGLVQGRSSYEILEALRLLLEALSRPRERTKYTRPRDDLISAVVAELRAILRQKSDEELTRYVEETLNHLTHVGVVHDVSFAGTDMCELTHDYIPDNLVQMQPLLLALWPAFLIRDIEGNVDIDLTIEDLNTIRAKMGLIHMGSAAASTLLLASLRLRHDGSFWFGCAQSFGVDVMSLLPTAVQQNDLDELDTIEFLSDVNEVESVKILMSFSDSEYLFDEIQEALITIAESKKIPAASAAEKALVELWTSRDWQGEQSKRSFQKLLIGARDSRLPSIRKSVVGLCRIFVKQHESASDLSTLLLERQVNAQQVEAIRTHLVGVDATATDDQILDPQFWRALADLPSTKVENVLVRHKAAPRETLGSAPNYQIIVPQLLKGAIIPFLGPEASRCHRRLLSGGALCPPSTTELAMRLARRAQLSTESEMYRQFILDLPQVASYFQHVYMDRDGLNDELAAVFDNDFEPNVLHRLLARVAADQPLLIITTNYDDMIERAFSEAKVPYHLVITTIENLQVKYQEPSGSELQIVDPQMLKLLLKQGSIIYKMNGSIVRAPDRSEHDFLITEEDYIEFFGTLLVPPAISWLFSKRRFLFLGYSLRDWNYRLMLSRRVQSEGIYKSWAIQYKPNIIERRLWEIKKIEIIDMDLLDFSNELMAQIDSQLSRRARP